jgi:hypothetical protein
VSQVLAKGVFEGHPYEIVPGGLAGVEDGLKRLKSKSGEGEEIDLQDYGHGKGEGGESNTEQK